MFPIRYFRVLLKRHIILKATNREFAQGICSKSVNIFKANFEV